MKETRNYSGTKGKKMRKTKGLVTKEEEGGGPSKKKLKIG